MQDYIARISYGKDSMKMLEVIHSRGLPLDRVTTTDVWATEDIPAWLPPMDEFKARMDQWIWTKYRIEVEHLCARNKDGTKRTYEQMFYHIPNRKSGGGQGTILGFPDLWHPWCQAGLKRNAELPSAGIYQRIPWNGGGQLVPEAQERLGPGYRAFRHKFPHGAKKSKSTRSELPFYLARHDGQREISWNTWALPLTSRTGTGS